ncbi:LytTR family DNA-binding domain-containing protein [Chryseobacterium sp. BIGb0232]|uniref:LytR/AlgR family response regulator transcription factor n=1 Tax=Chryseobacterium sp. BIGb0232 TaxID=2940598 RepID=UPI000F48FB4B|nr:response regulator transcription factor [Chryseobacterium sp. BIGb0232]MCS4304081.1 DNA-binding LytR/AlgR family response regulator [Chryseobacterium sp. BIGb0232]ROS17663.1 LytTR family two component transcriptional regulator [Chryseobacterium nakagawai]
MKHRCIIVDDEPFARELIASHLANFDNFEVVNSFENALKAYSFLEHTSVDLIFLDIEMPLMKGNDFLKKLKNPPKVIFTTAYREYAIEGYELNVIDYLLKPITFDRFFVSIEKFKQFQPSERESYTACTSNVFITSGSKNIKIIFDEILYIESLKDYITIHLENGKSHHVKQNISVFEKVLNSEFIRVHRSFIIHTKKITAYTKNEIEINSVEIPIGISYKENWLNYLETYILK